MAMANVTDCVAWLKYKKGSSAFKHRSKNDQSNNGDLLVGEIVTSNIMEWSH